MSLSFPVGSTTLEDKYSKLPDTCQVLSQRKMMVNTSTRQSSPFISSAGSGENLFSSSTRLPVPDVTPIPSVSTHERRPQNSPFITQLSNGRSLVPPMHCALPEAQSTTFIDHVEENKDISWCQDSIEDLLDFPLMESVQCDQVESSTVALTSDDQAERTDWSDWDPMISIGDDLDQYWPDLPVCGNGNALDSKSKMIQEPCDTSVQLPQNYQHQTLPSGEHSTAPDPSSAVLATKPRMRWTQELHEAFVESVGKLGGSERATPKGILTLMKVPGLTIYHVKSHLQKYRTARYKPEPAEEVSQIKSTPSEAVKSEEVKTSMGITEALRLQVELQKRLHEQLETQRKLQLQIEEQGKYLQKMFEQHKTMGNNKFKASTSTSSDPEAPMSNTIPKSAKHDKSETSEHPSTSSALTTLEESSRDPSGSKKAEETKTHDKQDSINLESDSPPSKRARC